MKVLILAGGYGTRLSEETDVRPKPMVEIGGRPILWHIMKHYSQHGFHDFVILLGYKGYIIKEFFANYFLHSSDVTIDLAKNELTVHAQKTEPWRVTLVDTGPDTLTGGRILRARNYVGDEPFLLTYGDGVSDVDLTKLVTYHKQRKRLSTMTVVQPEGRYGSAQFTDDGVVTRFEEKPHGDGAWINGGFFVCEPAVFDYLKSGDRTSFEREPLEEIVAAGQLAAYRHRGFWKCMDTLRDKQQLNAMWESGSAPWKTWT